MLRTALSVSLVVGGLAGSACSGPATRPGDQGAHVRYARNGTFTMATDNDLASFDPYHTNLFGYAKLAYDPLVNLRADGTYVSGLAERWTADAKSATFTLRRDVTCSDGTSLTASQVAADIRYVGDPKNQSPQYGVTTPTAPFTVTGDDVSRTIKIVMAAPFGFLLDSIGQLPIVCPKGLKDPKRLTTTSDGTGPFVLTSVVPGQSLTFTVRKGYVWGPGGARTSAPGTPAKVSLRFVANQTTAANLVLSGEVNMARVGGEDQQRLTAAGLGRIAVPAAGPLLSFNQLNGRTTVDKRVRQALVQALDLSQLIKVNTGGTGAPSTGLIAMEPRPCGDDTVAGRLPTHDVVSAAALLDQAGWKKGSDGIRSKDGRQLTLDLHYLPVSGYDRPTAELVSQQWKAVGVRSRLIADTPSQFGKVAFATSDWDAYLVSYGLYLPSQAVAYLSGLEPPKGKNYAGLHNSDYDALVAKAMTMTAPASCTYWGQAEHALWREVNPVPIATRTSFYYLKNAQAKATGFDQPIPTSIRVLG